MIADNNLAALWVTPKNDGDIRLDKGRTQKFSSWSSLTTSKPGQAAGSNPRNTLYQSYMKFKVQFLFPATRRLELGIRIPISCVLLRFVSSFKSETSSRFR